MDKILKDLITLKGISGYEKNIALYIENFIKKYPKYEIVKDNLGGVFGVLKSKIEGAKTVMVAGHMDEVGFIVVGITSTGLLELANVGGIASSAISSQVLEVTTATKKVYGVVPSIPPHLKEVYAESNKVFLDVGAKSKSDALSLGIKLGQMVTFARNFYELSNNLVMSRAIDDRFGCGVALEAIKHFHDLELPFNLVIGATVQEEVGLRGAEVAANIFNPDLFIALDASPINDALDPNSSVKLGNGFLLRILDPSNIMLQKWRDFLIRIASKYQIKYQHYVSFGATDAAKVLLNSEGVISTTIGIPVRYIHSSSAIFDYNDLLAAKKMLFRVLKTLKTDVINNLRNQ